MQGLFFLIKAFFSRFRFPIPFFKSLLFGSLEIFSKYGIFGQILIPNPFFLNPFLEVRVFFNYGIFGRFWSPFTFFFKSCSGSLYPSLSIHLNAIILTKVSKICQINQIFKQIINSSFNTSHSLKLFVFLQNSIK